MVGLTWPPRLSSVLSSHYLHSLILFRICLSEIGWVPQKSLLFIFVFIVVGIFMRTWWGRGAQICSILNKMELLVVHHLPLPEVEQSHLFHLSWLSKVAALCLLIIALLSRFC